MSAEPNGDRHPLSVRTPNYTAFVTSSPAAVVGRRALKTDEHATKTTPLVTMIASDAMIPWFMT